MLRVLWIMAATTVEGMAVGEGGKVVVVVVVEEEEKGGDGYI